MPRYALDPDGGGLAASSFYYLQLHSCPITREVVMDDRAELVAPSLRHARSYVAALREGFRRGAQERVSERRISQIEADFATYIEAITDQTGSVRLPTGQIVPKVPFSVFWLVEGDEFIGETHVRHQLNDYLIKEGGHVGYGIRPGRQGQGYGKLILALALDECRRLGLAPRAGHLSAGQRGVGAHHRGERRRARERDRRSGRPRPVAPLLDCAVDAARRRRQLACPGQGAARSRDSSAPSDRQPQPMHSVARA